MMTNEQRMQLIHQRLTAALSPHHLKITDNSQQHRGHPGAKSGGGHFSITISAAIFKDKTRVMNHRLVYDAVGDMMGQEIHALQIKILE